MKGTGSIVLIRTVQLIVSMAVAVIAVDLIIGIFRPESRGVVRFELAALITIGFTTVALAVSAAVRWSSGGRDRRL